MLPFPLFLEFEQLPLLLLLLLLHLKEVDLMLLLLLMEARRLGMRMHTRRGSRGVLDTDSSSSSSRWTLGMSAGRRL